MITRADVADLRPGDVVELTRSDWAGAIVRGPLRADGGHLLVAHAPVRYSNGEPAGCMNKVDWSLTVVSRAPRPLYVNSDRTEPVPGDVVRDADDDSNTRVWLFADPKQEAVWPWVTHSGVNEWWLTRSDLPDRLRLLVDGTTGRAVTS